MNRTVVKIDEISQANPEKNVWFDYYGDLFVSVVPRKHKKHIRRKQKVSTNKRDNSISVWHLKWQYELIENHYGIAKYGSKTYEIPVVVDGEKHIIDSLVLNKIAIEFQHTLSVSLDEMDSRSISHKTAGFKPYLVLDFTNFEYDEFKNDTVEFLKKIEKWYESDYFRKENLFLDLKDSIVRLSSNIEGRHVSYTKDQFIRRLLLLDELLEKQKGRALKKREREAEFKRIAEEKAEIRRKERSEQRFKEDKEHNREKKFNAPEYEYLRKCFKNSVIKPHIMMFAKDFIDYEVETRDCGDNIYEKCHIYSSRENHFDLEYITVSSYKMVEVPSRFAYREKRVYKYLFARVELSIRFDDKTIWSNFIIERGQTSKL